MSSDRRRAAIGAGPSAAINVEPGCHAVDRPAPSSAATARPTSAVSGPNSARYWLDETVLPDASRTASCCSLRGFRPKLKWTVVSAPAGPRRVDCRIATPRGGGALGGGGGGGGR